MVDTIPGLKLEVTNRITSEDLPTPVSPSSTTLTSRSSKVYEGLGLLYMLQLCQTAERGWVHLWAGAGLRLLRSSAAGKRCALLEICCDDGYALALRPR